MSLNKEIQYHEYGLDLCRDALKSEARYGEATGIVVTVCEDIIKYTGTCPNEAFRAVTQSLGHEDVPHSALSKARAQIGLPVLEVAA